MWPLHTRSSSRLTGKNENMILNYPSSQTFLLVNVYTYFLDLRKKSQEFNIIILPLCTQNYWRFRTEPVLKAEEERELKINNGNIGWHVIPAEALFTLLLQYLHLVGRSVGERIFQVLLNWYFLTLNVKLSCELSRVRFLLAVNSRWKIVRL